MIFFIVKRDLKFTMIHNSLSKNPAETQRPK